MTTKHFAFFVVAVLHLGVGTANGQSYCTADLYFTGSGYGCNMGSVFTYSRIDDFILYGEGGTKIIDTVTGCGMSAPGAYSSTSYRDMTTLPPVELIADSSYNGSVKTFGDLGDSTFGYDFYRIQIWIDHYNDFFFDSTDLVRYDTSVTPTDGYSRLFLSLPSTPSNVVPFRMMIPAAAQPGLHRMRVRTTFNTSDSGSTTSYFTPCGQSFWGETHDYTIKIVPRPVDTTAAIRDLARHAYSVAPNPSCSVFTLGAGGLPPSSNPVRLTVTDGSGRIVAQHSVASKALGAGGFPIDLSARPTGIYFLRIEGEGRATVVEKLVKI